MSRAPGGPLFTDKDFVSDALHVLITLPWVLGFGAAVVFGPWWSIVLVGAVVGLKDGIYHEITQAQASGEGWEEIVHSGPRRWRDVAGHVAGSGLGGGGVALLRGLLT
jgi:hypothetical protein